MDQNVPVMPGRQCTPDCPEELHAHLSQEQSPTPVSLAEQTFPVLFDYDWSSPQGRAWIDPYTSDLRMRIRPGSAIHELLTGRSESTRMVSISFRTTSENLLPRDPRAEHLLKRFSEEIDAIDTLNHPLAHQRLRRAEVAALRHMVEQYAGLTMDPARLHDAYLHSMRHSLLVAVILPLLKARRDAGDADVREEWLH